MSDQSDQIELQSEIERAGKSYEQVLISAARPETGVQSVKLACRLTEPSSVLHIINVTTTAPFPERVASWRESTQLVTEMAHMANRWDRVAKPLAATSASIPGSILNSAEGIGADLIILGWFGQVTPIAVRQSSVVRRVLDKANADVAVLKSRSDLDDVARLIVPVHDNYSKARIALVQNLLQQMPQAVLVHVLAGDSELSEEEAQMLLDEPAQVLGPQAQTQVVHSDSVVDGILSVAQPEDLIVVGPGREWVFSRFLFGHHADMLADRAPCSVLMYKARRRKTTAWFLGLLKAIRRRLPTRR